MTRLFRLLPSLLLLAALLLPMAAGLWHRLHPEPDLRWTLIESFYASPESPHPEDYEYGTGFTLLLRNIGNAATPGPVRVELMRPPADLRLHTPRGLTASHVEIGGGHFIEVAPMEPGHSALLIVYGTTEPRGVAVAGESIDRTELPPPDFAPEPWLPNGAVPSLALLLAGLALLTLQLHRRAAL
jgi:hypothetical protein